MNTNDLKEQLRNLYQTKVKDFKNIKDVFPEDDLAGPFLISPNELYLKQSKRLMIVGQQTNGWSYFIEDVDKQMKTYEEFNLGIDYYSSPFWNITRKVERALGNDEYSCVWTNLFKFDLDANRPYGAYDFEVSKLDSIFIKEIEILQPDICIFFTGPSFDHKIEELFKGINFEKVGEWEERQLCKLKHKNLPVLTYRTHHPKSLRLRYLEEDFINFVKNIK